MDITYLGKSGVRIAGKNLTVLVDPVELAAKPKFKDEVIVLTDQAYRSSLEPGGRIVIDGPGEYEVQGALMVGVPANLARSEGDKPEGAVYRIEIDDFRVAVVGNVKGKLANGQIEQLSEAEVLIVPVGGSMKASDASEIISQLEPKYVVPVGYDKLDEFLSEMGSKPEIQPKLKLVSKDLPLETTVTPLAVAA